MPKRGGVAMSIWIEIIILVIILLAGGYAIKMLEKINSNLNVIRASVVALDQAIVSESLVGGQLGWLVNQLSDLVPKMSAQLPDV
jgi:hypothetical protein